MLRPDVLREMNGQINTSASALTQRSTSTLNCQDEAMVQWGATRWWKKEPVINKGNYSSPIKKTKTTKKPKLQPAIEAMFLCGETQSDSKTFTLSFSPAALTHCPTVRRVWSFSFATRPPWVVNQYLCAKPRGGEEPAVGRMAFITVWRGY